ncbi:hypothetical protein B0I32_106324 [Nonomuraea fuscirosea]|uniref:Uncharacterized protein n=1 Tax=Nonomuraea fuscirosea TaxID=1291556 RepID=A0A2T0N2H3_9ACTN|nr:hypothetical protein [Nonomuraea fuscirosea]PRX66188.1 hypothetical protein B0I32_106324 [Nonomuraea fuscirosea]
MSSSPNPATKTGRAAIARKARSHGYFHDTNNHTIGVNCPMCRERVEGSEPGHGEIVTSTLDALMDTHLLYDCTLEGLQK